MGAPPMRGSGRCRHTLRVAMTKPGRRMTKGTEEAVITCSAARFVRLNVVASWAGTPGIEIWTNSDGAWISRASTSRVAKP